MPKLRIALVQVTPFQQNCSVFFDEETKLGAVVDPGGDVEQILETIAKTGATITKILLTHGHVDHTSGAAELRDKLKVKIEGPHLADKMFMDVLETRAPQFGIVGARNVESDRWLVEGDEVEAAGFTFNVIHAPGHSPGSVVFYNAENSFCFMGDVLFKGSVGRTDLLGSSHDDLINSITQKILPLGDTVNFLPGHGQPSSVGEERRTNPFLTGRAS